MKGHFKRKKHSSRKKITEVIKADVFNCRWRMLILRGCCGRTFTVLQWTLRSFLRESFLRMNSAKDAAAGRYVADMVHGGTAGGRAQIQEGQGMQTTQSA